MGQAKNASFLFLGNILIKLSGFVKQILLAYFLGVSNQIDLFLMAQIVPTIIQGMLGGGGGEIIVTKLKAHNSFHFLETYIISLFSILIAVIIIYVFTISAWQSFFSLVGQDANLFFILSLIFTFNLIPSFFSSILQPLLYSKGLYKLYIYRTVISEIIAIIFIFFTVEKLGIISFAISICMSFVIASSLYLFNADLKFSSVLKRQTWLLNQTELKASLKQSFLLGLQTMIFHFSTFWERTLSIKYLAPGYLSSFNYAKNLSEMPKSIFLSSILTTTYIEQSKKNQQSPTEFGNYTRKMGNFLTGLAAFAQIFLAIFAPLVVILIYRRGKFDDEAVKSTLMIFQIINIGFIPSLIFHFLSRTMYIILQNKNLLIAIVIKACIQLFLLIRFIDSANNILPISLIISNYFIAFYLSYLLFRNNRNAIDIHHIFKIITFAALCSTAILVLYQPILNHLISFSTIQLAAIYALPALFLIGIVIWFVKKDTDVNKIYETFVRKLAKIIGK